MNDEKYIKQQEAYQNSIIKHIELCNKQIENHKSYNKTIFIIGYGTLIGLTKVTYDAVGILYGSLSYLLTALSALFFVIFEIITMLQSNNYYNKLGQLINNLTLSDVEKNYKIQSEAINLHTKSFNDLAWKITFYPSLVFGMSAALIMIIAYFEILIENIKNNICI